MKQFWECEFERHSVFQDIFSNLSSQLDFSVREEQQLSTNSPEQSFNSFSLGKIENCYNEFDIEVKEEKVFQPIV
jgi:hypothetical protein